MPDEVTEQATDTALASDVGAVQTGLSATAKRLAATLKTPAPAADDSSGGSAPDDIPGKGEEKAADEAAERARQQLSGKQAEPSEGQEKVEGEPAAADDTQEAPTGEPDDATLADADIDALTQMADRLKAGLTRDDVKALGPDGARRILLARARERASAVLAGKEKKPEAKPEEPEKQTKAQAPASRSAALRKAVEALDADVETPETLAALKAIVDTVEQQEQTIAELRERKSQGQPPDEQAAARAQMRAMDAFDDLLATLPAEYEPIFGKGRRLDFISVSSDGKVLGLKDGLERQWATRSDLWDWMHLLADNERAMGNRDINPKLLFEAALRRGGFARKVEADKQEKKLATALDGRKPLFSSKPTHAASPRDPTENLRQAAAKAAAKLRESG